MLIRVGAKMLMILFIAFLAGIIRCRYWTYWKWALIMLAWAIVAPVLFAVGGALEKAAGDGIISHQFRTATNDGPGMELFGLAYLLVFWRLRLFHQPRDFSGEATPKRPTYNLN